MGKEIATQVQETQRVPNRRNPRQNTQDILIKLTKIKHKEQILKAAREKQKNNTQGDSHKDLFHTSQNGCDPKVLWD